MEHLSLFVAFGIGLLGGAHCIGMCGGIMSALTLAIQSQQVRQRVGLIVCYNLGRLVSYTVIAVLFYTLLQGLERYFALDILRYLAALLLILMGCYLADWWRGLVYLETLGGHLWRHLQPIAGRLLPVAYRWQAFLLGLLWGWLPCGLIYTALVYSATASNVYYAAWIMLMFGLGTLPALVATGLLAETLTRWVQARKVRLAFACVLVLLGLWTLVSAYRHPVHHPSTHEHSLRY